MPTFVINMNVGFIIISLLHSTAKSTKPQLLFC